MAFLNVTNRAESTLASSITDVATSLTVAAGQGVLFPATNFVVTIEDERILVTTRTTDVFDPVTRGYDGTTNVAHSSGAAVALRIIAKHITELQTAKLSQFAATTSAELAGVISDETGTLKLVYSDSPVFTTKITAPSISQTNAIQNKSKLLQTEDIFSAFVVTGLLPVTSANLTSDISAGHAYVTGVRVNNSATSKTYTASKDTYVDVNSAGTYTFPEVALGAGAPAVTADSIRLAKVVTNATAITGVTDLRDRSVVMTRGTNTVALRVTGTATGANWSGRVVAGGPTVVFLLGQYNDKAWLGAHTAALNAWADFYINPDGAKKLFLGAIGGYAGGPAMTVNNADGNVGIGITTPTAFLHIKAGTAGASTAPLKFTSGTLLTTPEAGAVEFLTDAYYGTITTGTVRKAFMLGRTAALTSAATIAVDWNNASVYTLTPAHDATLNASGGQSGNMYSIVITTSGTTAYTLTFGTAFKTVGTLATGTADAKVFTINFVYDGTNFNEMSRTTAM